MQKLVHLRNNHMKIWPIARKKHASWRVTVTVPGEFRGHREVSTGSLPLHWPTEWWGLWGAVDDETALTNLFVDFMAEWEHQTDVFHVSRKCWDSSQEKWPVLNGETRETHDFRGIFKDRIFRPK